MKKAKDKKAAYETRYPHKLNMLGPGLMMLKLASLLLLAGFLFWFLQWKIIAAAAWIMAVALFAVLLILVAVELHQDKVLNEMALEENKEREKNGEIF